MPIQKSQLSQFLTGITGRYVVFRMAEVAVPKELLQEILRLTDGQ